MSQSLLTEQDGNVAKPTGGTLRDNESPIAPGYCPVCRTEEGRTFLRGPDRFHHRPDTYELLRCPACTLVWLADPPKPAEMHAHYGADYDRFIGFGGDSSPERWRERQRAISRYKTGGALLDLGCSTGSFLASLKGQSWDLHGVEISVPTAKIAEARSCGEIFVGDVLDAPFQSETFDVITSFDVLEHVYEPREVLSKVHDWLKPGGIYYTLVPNINAWEARLFGSYWYGLELPRHLSHFSPQSLRSLAESVGFEVASLATHRNSAFIYSARYLYDDLLRGMGISRVSLAEGKPANPSWWRATRKMFRLTALPLFSGLASLAGAGESIHAVFRKG
jgi:2-polyprenyl-3-methyl-5-hydroxy-6-metoxy-1,4-benzoquinol methylase